MPVPLILLVEDEPEISTVISDLLDDAGFRIEVASVVHLRLKNLAYRIGPGKLFGEKTSGRLVMMAARKVARILKCTSKPAW